MGAPIPKVFLPIKGKPMILHSFELFAAMEEIEEIVVVCPEAERSLFPKKTLFAEPGARRQDSVKNGFLKTTGQRILIHDGARPYITAEDVKRLLVEGGEAAALGSPVKNTIKQIAPNGEVIQTLPRETLWEVYTPQLLSRTLLKEGLITAQGETALDDVSLAERLGHPVTMVKGRTDNVKITTPMDLSYEV